MECGQQQKPLLCVVKKSVEQVLHKSSRELGQETAKDGEGNAETRRTTTGMCLLIPMSGSGNAFPSSQ